MKNKILILLWLITCQSSANNAFANYTKAFRNIIDMVKTVVQSDQILWTLAASNSQYEFGSLVVRGDFNGDSYDDVAISIPGYGNNGAVYILHGTLLGLSTSNVTFLPGSSTHNGDGFGFSLAAGDFDGDGKDDLAVGVPFYDFSGATAAGVITIYEGSASGLQTTSSITIATGQGQSERFGYSMAAGDYNGDGKDDLAVSSPYKTFNGVTSAGEVRVYNGTTSGLTTADYLVIRQGVNGVFGVAEENDLFGFSLASGDFDKDASDAFFFDDLAIGVPYEDYHVTNDGVVQVLTGSPAGLVYSRLWSQDDSSDETSEDDDMFGYTLATGNLNGSFPDDLADELIVGVQFEDIGAITNAGVVHVFYGSPSGLVEVGNQTFSQDSPGIFGVIEADDQFGYSLATGNINPDHLFDAYDDLFIGAPYESYSAVTDGVVHIILGGENGADASNSIFIANPSAEDYSYFGNSLAVLSAPFYNSDQYSRSLIVGLPGHTVSIHNDAGAISEYKFINDKIFKNDFE
jgi:hypothetical protein